MPTSPISPRRPRGPHLNALRAFEAAARLGSFIAAAEELSVTPGAIAQHVKALEAWAGTRLFRRHARGIEPTPLARELLPQFVTAFDGLAGAVQALRTRAAPDRLRIAALPAVAQLWLPARLAQLREALPQLSVSVFAFETPPNLAREPYDLAIFFGPAPPEGGQALTRDRIFPVCTPDLAQRLLTPADLAQVPLIHDATWHQDWELWLTAEGTPAAGADGPVFSLYSLALEQALAGAGVLMAHECLVAGHLAAGRLVAPFARRLPLDRWLTLTGARSLAAHPHLERVLQVLSDPAE